ncbi:SDR family NAD(P)-dependent oxidoreductase [Bacillus sp. EAC]|uniref:SDR family NAD(P)-dependent oxidoreductase n=1 Tax=Bacillus sp. EAC TaxID=1978338 RepID=UPI000B44A9C9|nr:SDR family NAD(P)-dependent oxidoreductase [Bacillus sp. EAC]
MKWMVQGRVALVTGASRGLGAGLVERMAKRGMKVVLFGLEPELMKEVATPFGSKMRIVEGDVTSLEDLKGAVNTAISAFGKLDVVVANAGIGTIDPLENIDPNNFRKVIDVNLIGVFNTLHAAAPSLKESKGYAMVVSSMAAFIQSPLNSHYTASKAAVFAMANCFRLEMRPFGVDVGTIHPSFANTDMMKEIEVVPGGKQLWNGNKGVWGMLEPEVVIDAMEHALLTRKRMTVVPKKFWLAAMCPSFAQPLIERFFTKNKIKETLTAYTAGKSLMK